MDIRTREYSIASGKLRIGIFGFKFLHVEEWSRIRFRNLYSK